MRKHATRSHIFQREDLIIITHHLLFIGELRENNTSLQQIYGRVIITQIDRLPKTQHVNSGTSFFQPFKFKFLI